MMSPSYLHAYVSGKLIAIFHQFEQYSVFSELTLQLDKDYVADVCLYPKRPINFVTGDIIKMTEMPLLIAEVLSPTQGIQEILDKFAKFFEAGVKSCWLVIPVTQTVTVYSSMEQAQTFSQGDIVDPSLGFQISVHDVFV